MKGGRVALRRAAGRVDSEAAKQGHVRGGEAKLDRRLGGPARQAQFRFHLQGVEWFSLGIHRGIIGRSVGRVNR